MQKIQGRKSILLHFSKNAPQPVGFCMSWQAKVSHTLPLSCYQHKGFVIGDRGGAGEGVASLGGGKADNVCTRNHPWKPSEKIPETFAQKIALGVKPCLVEGLTFHISKSHTISRASQDHVGCFPNSRQVPGPKLKTWPHLRKRRFNGEARCQLGRMFKTSIAKNHENHGWKLVQNEIKKKHFFSKIQNTKNFKKCFF